MQVIPQMIPWIDDEDAASVSNYMKSGGFITEFKVNEMFENQLASTIGSKFCITCPNGTLSLSIALMALDIGPGDEVIVPNYTMIATANAVKMVGAKPVFVDVELSTLWIDHEEITSKVTHKTKAIIVVAANGRYPIYGIDKITSLCKELNLFLIEDAAQSLGSYYPDGRHIGSAGIFGSFSFSAPKIITTGQGGCLVTDNQDLADKVRKIKDFGRTQGGLDIHDHVGFNFKFTDLQASLGLSQLNKLVKRVELKKKAYERYKKQLSEIRGLIFIENDIRFTSPWFYEILIEDRQILLDKLNANGIKTRKMYPPINAQKAYREAGNFPNSEMIGENGLWLPSFTQISPDQIDLVCDSIADALGKI
jgi:perosamine synthetase